jgi:hypothetical protein
LQRSIDAGHAVKRLPAIKTSAGAIEGGIAHLPFEVLRDLVGLAHISAAHVTEVDGTQRGGETISKMMQDV